MTSGTFLYNQRIVIGEHFLSTDLPDNEQIKARASHKSQPCPNRYEEVDLAQDDVGQIYSGFLLRSSDGSSIR